MEPIQRKGLPVKLTVVIMAVALAVIVYMTMYDSANEPQSFRGIKWGGSLQDLSGLTLLAEDGDLKFYERADDRMKLGDIPLEKIIYGFHKGRFYNVMMYYSSADNFARSKEVLSRQHGEPYQPAPSEKKLFWDADSLGVLLTFDDASNTGRVTYIYKPIENEMGGNAPQQASGSSS